MRLLMVLGVVLVVGLHACEYDSLEGLEEEWGYIDVRPSAHQFWWFMRSPCDKLDGSNKPIVIWLQGGPGGSGTGYGNFMEIGPLDNNLVPRNHTWLKEASLIFIDSPVGAGFSYVDSDDAYTTTVYEVADDLVVTLGEVSKFLKSKVYKGSIPKVYIFSESYGGKVAPVFGAKVIEAQEQGLLQDVVLGGVAIGDGAVSLLDAGVSYPEYVYQTSQIDYSQYTALKEVANSMDLAYQQGEYDVASYQLGVMMSVIANITDDMFAYNIRYHHQPAPSLKAPSGLLVSLLMDVPLFRQLLPRLPSAFLALIDGGDETHRLSAFHGLTIDYNGDNVRKLMNEQMREKFGVIPDTVKWGAQAMACHQYLAEEMIIDVIATVDECLAKGVNVTVYNGMLDFIINSPGQERWMRKLSWEHLASYFAAPRVPLYPPSLVKDQVTTAFYKSYKNLEFYWVLMSGHMVPIDQPEMAREMMRRIISK